MTNKDPATAAAEAAAKEVVKLAYGDLLQPAAREVGTELGEFVRAIFVAGRGFGYLIRETYEPFILQALKKVPKEKQIAPPPSLLGQILEGVSLESKNTHVWKMSNQLLSNAMNVDKSHNVHPAFVDVIHRLSAREIIILKKASQKQVIMTAKPFGSSFVNIRYLDVDLQLKGPVADADMLFDNLNVSGLLNFLPQKLTRQSFKDFDEISQAVQKLRYGARESGSFVVIPSPFGQAFLAACEPHT